MGALRLKMSWIRCSGDYFGGGRVSRGADEVKETRMPGGYEVLGIEGN